jgi:hypothetical protein
MVAHPSTTISPSSAAGATAPESLLARYISAHVRKGEQAEERADQAREKVEQHFIAAGARQIIENVTGFFSTLQEWRVPKFLAPGIIKLESEPACGSTPGATPIRRKSARINPTAHKEWSMHLKALADRAHLLRAWRRWHVERLEEALEGVHGAVLERLMAQLKDLHSARELVDFIAAQDWSVVDTDTRFTALHEINIAITKLRERNGQEPISDPLPGAPQNAFRIIKNLFKSFPPRAGERAEAIGVGENMEKSA